MSIRNTFRLYHLRFIRWLAREHLQQADDRFTRFRQGCIHEAQRERAETQRLATLAGRYCAALATISRLRANTPASEIAYRALRPHGQIGDCGFLCPQIQTTRSFVEQELGVKFTGPDNACDSAAMLGQRGASEKSPS